MKKGEYWHSARSVIAYTSFVRPIFLVCMQLVRPVLEYGSACLDPCRGQIKALDRV